MSSFVHRAADRALTLGALLGVAALLSALLGAALGVRPLSFRSGSMSPTIGTGALALARSVPATELRVGDVVSVTTASGSRVTHRVVRTETQSGQVLLTLRGDANRVPDAERYPVESAYRVFWHVPWLGYAVGAMMSPVGLFGLGLAVMGLLVLAGRRHGGPPSGGRRARRGSPHRRRARRVGATAVATMAVIAGPAGPASAAWTDPVAVSGTTLTAYTVPAPASSSCSSLLLAATVSWPADAALDYSVVLRRISSGSVVSTTQVTGAGNSVTYSGLASFGLVVGAGTVDFQVEITSYLANTTTWQSSSARVYSKITVLAILIGATVSCDP